MTQPVKTDLGGNTAAAPVAPLGPSARRRRAGRASDKVYLSYGDDDADRVAAERIARRLSAEGLDVWCPGVLPAGAGRWKPREVVPSCKFVVLLLSDQTAGMQQVDEELDAAREAGVPVLPFPLALVDLRGSPDLARRISSAHWIDAALPEADQLTHLVAKLRTDPSRPRRGLWFGLGTAAGLLAAASGLVAAAAFWPGIIRAPEPTPHAPPPVARHDATPRPIVAPPKPIVAPPKPATLEEKLASARRAVALAIAAAEQAGRVHTTIDLPPILDILVTGKAGDADAVRKNPPRVTPEVYAAWKTGHGHGTGVDSKELIVDPEEFCRARQTVFLPYLLAARSGVPMGPRRVPGDPLEARLDAARRAVADVIVAAEKQGLVQTTIEPPPILEILITGRAIDDRGGGRLPKEFSPEVFGAWLTGQGRKTGPGVDRHDLYLPVGDDLKALFAERARVMQPFLDQARKELAAGRPAPPAAKAP